MANDWDDPATHKNLLFVVCMLCLVIVFRSCVSSHRDNRDRRERDEQVEQLQYDVERLKARTGVPVDNGR
jgi:hypothetical protein